MEGLSLGVRKGAWTEEEDILLKKCIEKYGEGKWHQIPSRAGLNRCRKSCRLRWLNYLKPNIKRGDFAADEVDLIIRLHKLLGNRWSLIAGRLPGRTANDVKNYWNTHLLKKINNPFIKELKCKADDDHVQNPSNPNTNIVITPRPWTLSKKSFPRLDGNNNNNNTVAADSNYNSYCIPRDNDEIMWWEKLLMNDSEVDEQQSAAGSFTINTDLSWLGKQSSISNSSMGNYEKIGERRSSKAVEEGNNSSWNELFRDVELWNVFIPAPENCV